MAAPTAGANARSGSSLELQPIPRLVADPTMSAEEAVHVSVAAPVDEAEVQVDSERTGPASLEEVEIRVTQTSDVDAKVQSPASAESDQQQQQQSTSTPTACTVIADTPAPVNRIPSVARVPLPPRPSYLVSRAKSVSSLAMQLQ